MTTDQPGWAATLEERSNHLVILVTFNGEPAGMITLPEETSPETADRLLGIIMYDFNKTYGQQEVS